MKTPTLAGSLRYASGEELLLLTIFRGPTMKRSVDRELNRRAMLRRTLQQPSRVARRAA